MLSTVFECDRVLYGKQKILEQEMQLNVLIFVSGGNNPGVL